MISLLWSAPVSACSWYSRAFEVFVALFKLTRLSFALAKKWQLLLQRFGSMQQPSSGNIHTAFLHLSHHLLSPSPFKCMSASFCHHSLMKVAACYRNVGITTITFWLVRTNVLWCPYLATQVFSNVSSSLSPCLFRVMPSSREGKDVSTNHSYESKIVLEGREHRDASKLIPVGCMSGHLGFALQCDIEKMFCFIVSP